MILAEFIIDSVGLPVNIELTDGKTFENVRLVKFDGPYLRVALRSNICIIHFDDIKYFTRELINHG